MFSPLAYPDGAVFYDLITHVPPPSHLALAPFELYREPMVIIALADGKELRNESFSKRNSANGTGPTVVTKNVRALYQELEGLRDTYSKSLVHHVIIYDFVAPEAAEITMPEGISAIPPIEDCKRTTIKTVMCDVSSLLLAEMTALARSFEAMTAIESPGQYSTGRGTHGPAWGGGGIGTSGLPRRNSQFSDQGARPTSASQVEDRNRMRMSVPVSSSRVPFNSSSSTTARPSTPTRTGPADTSQHADGMNGTSSGPPTPEQRNSRPDTADAIRDKSRDRVSVQGFGPGGANDRWRLKGKGRVAVLIGSMYLLAGRWSDSLKELTEGAAAARSLNDHIWHGKALELIVMNLLLLGWSNLSFQVPPVCYPPQERPRSGSAAAKAESNLVDSGQPKHLRYFEELLPDLLERIIGLYSRISTENLPPLPFSEAAIRFSKILSALHLHQGKLNSESLTAIVNGKPPSRGIGDSLPRSMSPSRQHVITMLFKAFPSSVTELLTTVERVSILSGIASVLGPLGLQRKKAMVIRELVSVLISGFVDARTRGAAEAGIHPAAGLVSLTSDNGQSNGAAIALDLGEGDVEQGVEAFLQLLGRCYGTVSFDKAAPADDGAAKEIDDSDTAIVARIKEQSALRHFGYLDIKLNILRACINFSEALPDFHGVLKYSSDLLRTAGSGIVPGARRQDAAPGISKDEQVRLVTNISRTSHLVQRMGLSHLKAEYWDEFLVRGVKLEPWVRSRAPVPHAKSTLIGAARDSDAPVVDPFIYNPFGVVTDEAVKDKDLIVDEWSIFKVTVQNTYDIEVEIESIILDTEGVDFEATPSTIVLGPYRTQVVKLSGRPKESGTLTITGVIVKVEGCRERRFPIFEKSWAMPQRSKVKGTGLMALESNNGSMAGSAVASRPEIERLALKVISRQPLIVVKATSLPQSSIMLLEGERRVFSVTLQNLSDTPVDFIQCSFQDSTQEPLQKALNNRDATPTELYEYEWTLLRKQALRLRDDGKPRLIQPRGEATFEFEMLGKAGLTQAAIQIDYTYLGIPRAEVAEQFYTRQVHVELMVTVNASIELARVEAHLGHNMLSIANTLSLEAPNSSTKSDDYCLIVLDLRNAWPSQLSVSVSGELISAVERDILPGNTCRLYFAMKRQYVEDPFAPIPSLDPTRKRQFVVSTSKITPDMERRSRETFWYREKFLQSIQSTWRLSSASDRSGLVELRSIPWSSAVLDAFKSNEVEIDAFVEMHGKHEEEKGNNAVYVDEFACLKVRVTNRSQQVIRSIVRLLPELRHRARNIVRDNTRKIAWNGTLQQTLPEVAGGESTVFSLGFTALCKGEFEIKAMVEEIKVGQDANANYDEDEAKDGEEQHARGDADGPGRARSGTETMADALAGDRQRRVWHSRKRLTILAVDRN